MTTRARILAANLVVAGLLGSSLGAQQPAAGRTPTTGASAQSGGGGAPAALAILQRAATRYRASTAMCADFAQELTIPLLSRKTSSKGQLCLKAPGLLAMNWSDPKGDRVVVDGTSLWMYLPSQNARTAVQTTAATGNTFDFRREFLDEPAAKYTLRLNGKETVDGKSLDRVVLTPKQRSQYKEAELWIGADSVVRRVRYQEENGNVKLLTFSNINLRANPSAATFRFTPPAGVQVMKQP